MILGLEMILLPAVVFICSLFILKIDNRCKFKVFYQSYKLLTDIFKLFKIIEILAI